MSANNERDLLEELNQIRLEDDLSYPKLGRLLGMSGQTIQHLLKNRPDAPYDRTLHKIRKFLDARAAAQPKRSGGRTQQARA